MEGTDQQRITQINQEPYGNLLLEGINTKSVMMDKFKGILTTPENCLMFLKSHELG